MSQNEFNLRVLKLQRWKTNHVLYLLVCLSPGIYAGIAGAFLLPLVAVLVVLWAVVALINRMVYDRKVMGIERDMKKATPTRVVTENTTPGPVYEKAPPAPAKNPLIGRKINPHTGRIIKPIEGN